MKKIILTLIVCMFSATGNIYAADFLGSCNVNLHQICFNYLRGYSQDSAYQSCKKLEVGQFSNVNCGNTSRVGSCVNSSGNTIVESNFYSPKWSPVTAKDKCAESKGTFRN